MKGVVILGLALMLHISGGFATQLGTPAIYGAPTGALHSRVEKAAFIGPTNDWKPLLQGAKEFGISQESVDLILDAGMELRCPSDVEGEAKFGNAWNFGTIWTNAHAFYNKNDTQLEHWRDCHFIKYRDLLVMENIADTRRAFGIVPESLILGSVRPNVGYSQADRATVVPKDPPPDLASLEIAPGSTDLNVGDELFLVSRRPAFLRRHEADFEPLIQRVVVRKIVGQYKGMPAGFLSDADNHGSISGGSYFRRSTLDHATLVPVAMHVAGRGKVDYSEWNEENSAIALVYDDKFFLLRHR